MVLTGTNADGTAGLLNVVLHGGRAIVQDPFDAEYPTMPRSALTNVPGVRCLPLTESAASLMRRVTGPQVRRTDRRWRRRRAMRRPPCSRRG